MALFGMQPFIIIILGSCLENYLKIIKTFKKIKIIFYKSILANLLIYLKF
jgi:hypothetical protein